MKTIITAAVITTAALVGLAPQAEAGGHKKRTVYISESRHDHCDSSYRTERYFIGYDRCGNAIYGTRTVRTEYRQPIYRQEYVVPRPQPRYYQEPRYYSQPSCSSRSGTSISFSGFFR